MKAKAVKRKTGSQLCMEHILDEVFGSKNWSSEYRFWNARKWRFDYCLLPPMEKLAFEIEGAVWTRGRHTRGSGYVRDLEKYRTATALGWRVYRFATQEVLDGTAKKFLLEWCK